MKTEFSVFAVDGCVLGRFFQKIFFKHSKTETTEDSIKMNHENCSSEFAVSNSWKGKINMQ